MRFRLNRHPAGPVPARSAQYRASGTVVLVAALAVGMSVVGAAPTLAADGAAFFVATTGSDQNPGTSADAPVATLAKAQDLVRAAIPAATGPISVNIADGTYYLSEPLALTNADSGTESAPVRWVGTGAAARISGGRQLTGAWTADADDPTVMVTDVPAGIDFDELFIDDARQVMARYPNWDDSAPRLEGTTSLDTLNARAAGWATPSTGYVRAMHCHDWGSVSFEITGFADNQLGLDFVGDNNRPQDCGAGLPLKRDAVMVENIREELDAPGEWFLDRAAGKLFVKPVEGVDLATATVETGELDRLVTLAGTSPAEPIEHITLEGLHFERTHRTLFGDFTFEGVSRGDWSVVRTAAAYLKNAKDITITASTFTDLGGNGVFLDGYNENTAITGSRFENNGATDVHVLGSPDAVRNYAGNYFTTPPITDLGAGPKTEDYPRSILISGNVMRNNGRYEKQTSSINIGMALDVTVRSNSLSDSPRACLNFSDNTWGGHLIADNDIFDCVRETGDNGSINSWGRSRFWKTGAAANAFASLGDGVTFEGQTGGPLTAATAREMMKLDVVEPIVIDHNRFWHDGDWAIDLDDGSSNVVMTNNVLLKGGIKLRDGFDRTADNNLLVDGSIFEQVSYMPGGDEITHNVTLGSRPYTNCCQPDFAAAQYAIGANHFWNAGSPIDIQTRSGLVEQLSTDGATINTATAWYGAGHDTDSTVGDPKFAAADPTGLYDFTLAADSPAVATGYQNIPMTGFGAPGGALPPKAELPTGGGSGPEVPPRDIVVEKLMGADVTQIATKAEQSAYAISDFKGLKFAVVPDGSPAAEAGILPDDLVRTINGTEVTDKRNTFWQVYNALPAGAPIALGIRRASTDVTVQLAKVSTPEQLNNTAGVVYTEAPGSSPHWIWRNSSTGGGGAYLEEIDATQNIGDSWTLTFNGTGIDVISQVNTDMGDVDIEIDGAFYRTQSFYNPTRIHQQTVLSVTGLEPGVHTISGTMKTGRYMIVDAFRTHPAAAAPPSESSVSVTGSVSENREATITATVSTDGELAPTVTIDVVRIGRGMPSVCQCVVDLHPTTGVAVLTLPGLQRGVHAVTVHYPGSATSLPAERTIRLPVR